jgi:hypothetical protein
VKRRGWVGKERRECERKKRTVELETEWRKLENE